MIKIYKMKKKKTVAEIDISLYNFILRDLISHLDIFIRLLLFLLHFRVCSRH